MSFYWHHYRHLFLPIPQYTLETVTEPTEEPVTADELALHSRANTDDELALYPDFITTARLLFENRTGWTVCKTKYRQYTDRLDQPLTCQRGKTTQITLFKYYDPTETLQDVTTYRQDLTNQTGHIWCDIYPATTPLVKPVAYWEYWAGYATATVVPKDIKVAIRQAATLMIYNRESHTELQYEDLPLAWCEIVGKYSTGVGVY